MKKILLSTLAFIAFSGANAQVDPSQTPTPAPATPPTPVLTQNPEFIQFKELVYDFGNVKQGIPVSHIFEFKNVGTKDITLINVQASCGCTTPNWKGGIYKPQEVAQINATYNAASEGSFNKSITVTTSESITVLTIMGNVMNAAAYDDWKAKDDAAKEAAKKAQEGTKKGKDKKKESSKSKSEEKKKVGNGKGKGIESSEKKEEDKKPEDKTQSDAKKPEDQH